MSFLSNQMKSLQEGAAHMQNKDSVYCGLTLFIVAAHRKQPCSHVSETEGLKKNVPCDKMTET